jgi:hypothetical protein
VHLVWAWITENRFQAMEQYANFVRSYTENQVPGVVRPWFDLTLDQIKEIVPPSQIEPYGRYTDTWRTPYMTPIERDVAVECGAPVTPLPTHLSRAMYFDAPIPDAPAERQELYDDLVSHPRFVRWYEQINLGCDTAYEWPLFCEWWSERGANVKLYRAFTTWLKSDHCSHNRRRQRASEDQLEKAFDELVDRLTLGGDGGGSEIVG